LEASEVADAAHAAWSICISRPRSGILPEEAASPPWKTSGRTKQNSPLQSVAAAALLEVMVAKGLGLKLEAVFDDDKTDRRGFWRHFDSDSQARLVAKEALTLI
jgi:hypothetical protein